ncbi:YbjN domain-containing protein [uncultured Erythrobacter sp.]|uniref:YbjN domain-containing protein n=1 Tax=uncultured Erythrobacter sp. TaxID=263913 RepID=UPI00262CDB2B|nr:YbjN domain-containing protein [uncultured Erythrobacter sp.]
MKSALVALAAFATLALIPAGAQAQNNDTIKTFDRADLQRALEAMGATWEDAGDNRTINITFASNLKANGAVMACDDDEQEKNCYGTSILAIFDPEPGMTAEEITTAINTYNYEQNFGRAYVDPEGDVSVRMYIISDGGITRENYRTQIELWSVSLEYFTTYFYPEEAASAKKK